MALRALLARPRHMFYGWWIVVSGSIISAIGGGLHFFNSTVLFLPLSRDLGVSRAQLSLGLSMARAETSFEGPIVGWLIDRLGPRKMIFFGSILAAIGYFLLAQAHSFTAFLLIYLTILTLGQRAGSGAPIQAALNNWFVRRRAFVMSTVLAIFMVGGAIIPLALSMVVSQMGWRTAVVILGFGLLVVVPPLALLIRSRPEDMGLRPDGETREQAAPQAGGRRGAALGVDFTVGQALRSPSFWMLVLAVNFRVAVFGTFVIHFIPIMVWKGVSEQYAAFLLGMWNLMGVPARILLGWAADRWSKSKVYTLGLALGVPAMFLVRYGQPGWQLWLFTAVFAVVLAVTPLTAAIVGDFFGRKRFATIEGFFGTFTVIGSTLGPIAAGVLYDRTQSYDLILGVFMTFFAIAALILAFLKPPRIEHSAESPG